MSQLIQITLSLTAAQLVAVATLLDGGDTAAPAPTPRAAKPKVEPKAEGEVAKGAEVKGKDAAGEEVDELPSVDDVSAAAKGYNASNGRDALVSLLAEFDAKNASGVPEDRRAEFISRCNAE